MPGRLTTGMIKTHPKAELEAISNSIRLPNTREHTTPLTLLARNKFRYRSTLVEQMKDAQYRVAQQHARSGVAHHRFNAFTLRRAVTVDLASIAGRFLFLERTNLQALKGVSEQIFAITAECVCRGMVIAAKDSHHRPDR